MNLTFKQYRAIDLTIMAVLAVVSEAIVTMAASKWFPYEWFSVTTTLIVVCIVMMRWSGYAVLHAALGGFVYCLVLGGSPTQFAIYCAGNCGALLALVMFKIAGKKAVAGNFLYSALFVVIAYCGEQLGRWLISAAVTGGETATADVLAEFVAKDMLSLLFVLIAVFVSRRMDGLFEDQRAYLLRVDEERRKEQEEREKDNNGY